MENVALLRFGFIKLDSVPSKDLCCTSSRPFRISLSLHDQRFLKCNLQPVSLPTSSEVRNELQPPQQDHFIFTRCDVSQPAVGGYASKPVDQTQHSCRQRNGISAGFGRWANSGKRLSRHRQSNTGIRSGKTLPVAVHVGRTQSARHSGPKTKRAHRSTW